MKDILRLKTSLAEEIEQELNAQVKQEATASAMYLAMASWCNSHGFVNSAEFFYQQSAEEREHMMKIFKYVNEVGGRAVSPDISNLIHDFDSLKSVFEQALEQEINNTQSINRIVDRCYKVKDYTTIKFLQWFLEEQMEEEKWARRALELLELIGSDGMGLYMVDKKILDLREKE
ncbi:MAG: ferritin [Cytophagaceae bacterium]|nr:ferritin [Cytophagaceae bacterium]